MKRIRPTKKSLQSQETDETEKPEQRTSLKKDWTNLRRKGGGQLENKKKSQSRVRNTLRSLLRPRRHLGRRRLRVRHPLDVPEPYPDAVRHLQGREDALPGQRPDGVAPSAEGLAPAAALRATPLAVLLVASSSAAIIASATVSPMHANTFPSSVGISGDNSFCPPGRAAFAPWKHSTSGRASARRGRRWTGRTRRARGRRARGGSARGTGASSWCR